MKIQSILFWIWLAVVQFTIPVYAQQAPVLPIQGGTGTNNPQGILKGNGPNTPVSSASPGLDYMAPGNVQAQSATFATDSGAADAYVLTPSPAITAYTKGQRFSFVPLQSNDGASTLNVSGLGAVTITTSNFSAVPANTILAGQVVTVVYDGTEFQVVSGSNVVNAVQANVSPAGLITNTAPLRRLTGGSTLLTSPAGVAVDNVNNEIIVADAATNSIMAFSRTATGNVAPLRTISGSNAHLSYPQAVYVDNTNNEIGVVNANFSEIRIFSRTASGNVAPLRTISGAATTINYAVGIYVDTTNNEIGVTDNGNNSIDIFSRTASGNVAPLRSIVGAATALNGPYGVSVDTINNEIVVANQLANNIDIYSRTANGNVAPLRVIQKVSAGSTATLSQPEGVYVDPINNEIGITNTTGSVKSVSIYSRTATGHVLPLRIISGSSTTLNTLPAFVYIDTANNEIGVTSGAAIDVFSRIFPTITSAYNGTTNFSVDSTGNVTANALTLPNSTGILKGNGSTAAVSTVTAGIDYMTASNVQNQSATYCVDSSTSANTFVLTSTPPITNYTVGQRFVFIARLTNTAASTVNISGLGAKNLTTNNLTSIPGNTITAGMAVSITYDGTEFQCEDTSNVVNASQLNVSPSLLVTNTTPSRTVTGTSTTLNFTQGIAVDTTNNELCVIDQFNNSIDIFSRTANGNIAPLRQIVGAATGLSGPAGVYDDTVNNEIGVANDYNNTITIYSRTANGNVAPIRTISDASYNYLNTPTGIYVDTVNNEIGVGASNNNAITIYSRTANGNATPLRQIVGAATGLNTPSGIYVDTVNNEIGVANSFGQNLEIFSRTATGNVAPLRTISKVLINNSGTSTFNYPTGIYVDTVHNEIGITSANGAIKSVSIYSRTASGSVLPLRTIYGPSTNIFTSMGYLCYDPINNEIDVTLAGNGGTGSYAVYPRLFQTISSTYNGTTNFYVDTSGGVTADNSKIGGMTLNTELNGSTFSAYMGYNGYFRSDFIDSFTPANTTSIRPAAAYGFAPPFFTANNSNVIYPDVATVAASAPSSSSAITHRWAFFSPYGTSYFDGGVSIGGGTGGASGQSLSSSTGTITGNYSTSTLTVAATNIALSGNTTATTLALTNPLSYANGGTGQTTVSLGSLLIGNGSTSWTQRSIGSSGQFLQSTGTVPVWSTTLGAANGGTGLSSYTTGSLLYASASTTLSQLSPGATGTVLVGNTSAAPSYSAAPALTTSLTVPTVYGGTASGGGLTLNSTSNATKGPITFAGGQIANYRSVTSATTTLAGDYTIFASGTFTVTLLASPTAGTIQIIKNSGTGTVTVSSSANIDGVSTQTLSAKQAIMLQYDGTTWWII